MSRVGWDLGFGTWGFPARRHRLPALVVCVFAALGAAPAAAEDYAPVDAEERFYIPRSTEVERVLEQARGLAQGGRWAEAALLHDRLLEGEESVLVPAAAGAGPATHFVALDLAIQQRLAAWPPEGLAVYRSLVAERVAGLWTRARARGDRAALAELARRYLLAPSGGAAADLLARSALEGGCPAEALGRWQRLVELHALPAADADRVRLQAALAATRLGLAATDLAPTDLIAPERTVQFAGSTLPARELARRLEALCLAPAAPLSAARPERGALRTWLWWSAGPTLKPIALDEPEDAPDERPAVAAPPGLAAEGRFVTGPARILPARAGPTLYLQNGRIVLAVEEESGRVLECRAASEAFVPRREGEADEPVPEQAWGCAVAGERVVANLELRRRSDAWPCLVAFELESLHERWRTPFPSGREQQSSDLRFETPAVAHAGRFFAAALGGGRDREVFVCCLEAESGRILWRTRVVASPPDAEGGFHGPIRPPRVEVAAGVVVCDTGLPLIAGVEAESGRLRWARYAPVGPPPREEDAEATAFPFLLRLLADPPRIRWSWDSSRGEATDKSGPAWTPPQPLRVAGADFAWIPVGQTWAVAGRVSDGQPVPPAWLQGVPFATRRATAWTLSAGVLRQGEPPRRPRTRLVRIQGMPNPRVLATALPGEPAGDAVASAGELVVPGLAGLWRLDPDSLKLLQEPIPWPAAPGGAVTLQDRDGEILVACPAGIGRLSRPAALTRLLLDGDLPEERIEAHREAAARLARGGLVAEALLLEEEGLALAEREFGPQGELVRQARERALRRARTLARRGIALDDEGMVQKAAERLEKSGAPAEERAAALLYLVAAAGRRGDAALFAARARKAAALPPDLVVAFRPGAACRIDLQLEVVVGETRASSGDAALAAFDAAAERVLAGARTDAGAILRCLREFPGSRAAGSAVQILGRSLVAAGDLPGALACLRRSWEEGAAGPGHDELALLLARALVAHGYEGTATRLWKLYREPAALPPDLRRVLLEARRGAGPTAPAAAPPHPLAFPAGSEDAGPTECRVPRAAGPFATAPFLVLRRGYEIDVVDAGAAPATRWSRRFAPAAGAEEAEGRVGCAWIGPDELVIWFGNEVVDWRPSDPARAAWEWRLAGPDRLRCVAATPEVVVAVSGQEMVALDPRDGAVAWRRAAPPDPVDWGGIDRERGEAILRTATSEQRLHLRTGQLHSMGAAGQDAALAFDEETGCQVWSDRVGPKPKGFACGRSDATGRHILVRAVVGWGYGQLISWQEGRVYSSAAVAGLPVPPLAWKDSRTHAPDLRVFPTGQGGAFVLLPGTALAYLHPETAVTCAAWERTLPAAGDFRVVAAPGHPPLLVGLLDGKQDGYLAALAPESGRTAWELSLQADGEHAPEVEWVGSRLLVTDRSGPHLFGGE